MRRHLATGRKPAKAKQTIKAKRGTASKPARNRRLSESKDAEIARLVRELAEAREQQAATSQVLQIISTSPGELRSVFQAMLANAMRVCGAKFGVIQLYAGNTWNVAAAQGASAYIKYVQQHFEHNQPGPETVVARIARTKQMVHISSRCRRSRGTRWVARSPGRADAQGR